MYIYIYICKYQTPLLFRQRMKLNAKPRIDKDFSDEIIGTRSFRPPELVDLVNSQPAFAMFPSFDMWSAGIILYCIITKKKSGMPFDIPPKQHPRHADEKAKKRFYSEYYAEELNFIKKQLSPEQLTKELAVYISEYPVLVNIIKGCLRFDPDHRLTAREALNML